MATKTYHVSKREKDNMWAVTLAGGKVIKLCATKAEAEAYVETVAENQKGTVLIHNSKGKKAGKIAEAKKHI